MGQIDGADVYACLCLRAGAGWWQEGFSPQGPTFTSPWPVWRWGRQDGRVLIWRSPTRASFCWGHSSSAPIGAAGTQIEPCRCRCPSSERTRESIGTGPGCPGSPTEGMTTRRVLSSSTCCKMHTITSSGSSRIPAVPAAGPPLPVVPPARSRRFSSIVTPRRWRFRGSVGLWVCGSMDLWGRVWVWVWVWVSSGHVRRL
jgi:hypothetical protein